jgi:DNA primase
MDKDRTNIDLVKERTDIVSVVQKYVNLKQAGKNLSGLCPFHQEKTPSFNVSPQLQIYKCFGCGKTGDVITFVQEVEKIEFVQALEMLAKDAGVVLKQQNQPMPVAYQLNKWAQLFYQKSLHEPKGQLALEYLNKRGISENEIKTFGIGYSAGDGSFLNNLLKYKNFSKKILLESGLFIDKNGEIKEKFNKRVIFPIHNNSGKVIAFTARKLPNNEYGPKYLNSPESQIYHKRSTLYGFYQAKGSIKRDDLCIILEGTTDVISMHKAGFTNTVAPLGTSLTIQQLELLKGYTKNLLFIFDNDTAGQTALERSFKLATPLGFTCFSLNTGKYKDIDEFIQNEPEKLTALIANRNDAFSYLLANKIEQVTPNSLAGITKIEYYIKSLINAVSDETELTFYHNKIRQLLPELNLEERFARSEQQKSNVKNETFDIEERFLSASINDQILLEGDITKDYFFESTNQALFEILVENKGKDPKEIYEGIKNTLVKNKLEKVLLLVKDDSNSKQLVERLTVRYLENKVKECRSLLAVAEEKEDTTKVKIYMDQIIQLTNKIRNIKG